MPKHKSELMIVIVQNARLEKKYAASGAMAAMFTILTNPSFGPHQEIPDDYNRINKILSGFKQLVKFHDQ